MILFFTSPIGLGHATRDIAISNKINNTVEKTFITGQSAHEIISKNGYRTLDLYKPRKFSVNHKGQLQRPFIWLLRYLSYYNKCRKIAKDIITKNEGLIVSDEDFASISISQEFGRKHILITDITEIRFTSGFSSILENQMNKGMRRIMRKCDQIIIPELGEDKDNVVYVGPIVREPSASRDILRKKFGISKKTILLCVGGTDAGKNLVQRSVEVYKKIRKRIDADLIVSPGPSIELDYSTDFRNIGFVENLHEYIYAADLVISLAGRSTMDECFSYGTPGIFIPIKNHFEQENGAKRAGYKYEDIHRLETLIEQKLGDRNNNPPLSHGAELAAKLISKFL